MRAGERLSEADRTQLEPREGLKGWTAVWSPKHGKYLSLDHEGQVRATRTYWPNLQSFMRDCSEEAYTDSRDPEEGLREILRRTEK